MKWRSGDHFAQRLQRRGYVYLGGGCYSQVWAKPNSKRVIKVLCGMLDPWAEYVLWATQRGYAGKLAPLVYSFRVIPTRSDGVFYVAVVERLSQTVWQAEGNKTDGPMTKLAQTLSRAITNGNVPLSTEHEEFVSEFRKTFHNTYRYTFDLHMSNWMVDGDRLILVDPISGEGTTPSRRWRHNQVAQQLAA